MPPGLSHGAHHSDPTAAQEKEFQLLSWQQGDCAGLPWHMMLVLAAGCELLGRSRQQGLIQKPLGLIPPLASPLGWNGAGMEEMRQESCSWRAGRRTLCLLPIPNLCQAWGRC